MAMPKLKPSPPSNGDLELHDMVHRRTDGGPLTQGSEPKKPSTTDYLAKRKDNLTKLVSTLEQQIEQITAQANNEIGARKQNITAAKAEIAEIEGLLGE